MRAAPPDHRLYNHAANDHPSIQNDGSSNKANKLEQSYGLSDPELDGPLDDETEADMEADADADADPEADGEADGDGDGDGEPPTEPSALHPRVAVILGVDRRWYIPLLLCRGISTLPAAWWGLRCAFTFLAELLRVRELLPDVSAEGVSGAAALNWSWRTWLRMEWDAERLFRVAEVALAIMWVCMASVVSCKRERDMQRKFTD